MENRRERSIFYRCCVLGAFLSILFQCDNGSDFAARRGDYLGQTPPGKTPKVFAPGIISHGFHEHHLTISPEGDEMFYVSSSIDHQYYVILQVRRVNGIWGMPEVAPFSGSTMDMGPSFSPDGKRIYFNSKRPLPGMDEPKDDFDIWLVEKSGENWSDPVHLGSPINTDQNEIFPSIAANGTIYFQVYGEKGSESDFYYARGIDGHFEKPVKLEYGISTEHYESHPAIAPDEGWIIFQSIRPGGFDGVDFYISFRNVDNTWTEPVNLGKTVSSPGNVISPMISPDGKYFFFARNGPRNDFTYDGRSFDELLDLLEGPENGYGTIYWVDARVIEPSIQGQ